MEYIIWLIIILLFIFSFVGLIYPVIPSVLLIWIGVLLYHFGIDRGELTWLMFTSLGVLTILLFLADILANLHFVDKAGGTKWGMRAATFGLIIGSLVIPPFGVIIFPFILVFIVEFLQKKTVLSALKISFGTLIAFLTGTFAKAVIQILMIIIFVIDVIL